MKLNTDFSHLSHRKTHAPRRPLPWVASPIDEHETAKRQKSIHAAQSHTHQSATSISQQTTLQDEPPPEKTNTSKSGQCSPQDTEESHGSNKAHSTHTVFFKPRHESTAIELFYDLFLVANLTIYTSNNEIQSADALAAYLGYFTLLWFNWLQVSLFDVRFATNSVWSRACKAGALCCMGLLAFASTPYSTFDPGLYYIAFRVMCYGLLLQRGILVFQYGLVLFQARKYREATLPIGLTMAVSFTSCMTFTGMIFTFRNGVNSHTYVVLYAISIVEGLLVMGISCHFRTISFRSTNLVERIGLLTLIVIGEGVIGVIRAMATVLINVSTFTHTMVGVAYAALLVLHELWILYFDQVDHDRFGTIRQQIWTLLHFPLHMALILTMQGNARFIIWKSWWDTYNMAFVPYLNSAPSLFNSSQLFVSQLQQNITTFSSYFNTGNFSTYYDYQANLTDLSQLDLDSQQGQARALVIWNELAYAALNYAFEALSIEPPGYNAEIDDPEALYNASIQVFVVSYIYYIIGAGMFLVLLGIMYWFGKRSKSRFEYASIVLRIVSGTALALVALAVRGNYQDGNVGAAAWGIVKNSWIIPIVLFVYGIVIIVDDTLIWLGWRRYQQTRRVGNWEESEDNEDMLGQPAE